MKRRRIFRLDEAEKIGRFVRGLLEEKFDDNWKLWIGIEQNGHHPVMRMRLTYGGYYYDAVKDIASMARYGRPEATARNVVMQLRHKAVEHDSFLKEEQDDNAGRARRVFEYNLFPRKTKRRRR